MRVARCSCCPAALAPGPDVVSANDRLACVPLILDSPVRTYAWGSPTVIPALLGVPATGERQAELWMGAHPAAPSSVTIGGTTLTLAELIEKNPEAMLGPVVLGHFGPRLPYLLKILAIDKPLSIQAHPTIEQAEAGYRREEQAGIPLDAPNRSYRDRSHKPEMLVALTDVEALLGFREPAETADLLDELAVPALTAAVAELRADGAAGLELVVRRWLSVSAGEVSGLVRAVVAAAEHATGELAELVRRLAEEHPGDRGLLLALLLRRVRLTPGEAAFIPAGVPHSYLRGVAVEAQASSDNTLRAGLTVKHVDVDDVLRILRFDATPDLRVRHVPMSPRAAILAPGVADFVLTRVTLDADPVTLEAAGPRIVLVTEGAARVSTTAGEVELGQGRAAFVPAAEGAVSLTGRGQAVLAAPDL